MSNSIGQLVEQQLLYRGLIHGVEILFVPHGANGDQPVIVDVAQGFLYLIILIVRHIVRAEVREDAVHQLVDDGLIFPVDALVDGLQRAGRRREVYDIGGGGAVEPKQDVGQGGEYQQGSQNDDEQEDHTPLDDLWEK